MNIIDETHLQHCRCCGLTQQVPKLQPGQIARCARCHSKLPNTQDGGDNVPAFAAALSAGILFFPAISLPIIHLEKLGFVQESSIISGALSLLHHGEIVVGLVVLICSVIFPLGKIIALIVLCFKPPNKAPHVALVHRVVEHLGRWGMIDILLVAVMVSALKLGDLVAVSPGPAALLFTAMVICNMASSAWFKPHLLWQKVQEN